MPLICLLVLIVCKRLFSAAQLYNCTVRIFHSFAVDQKMLRRNATYLYNDNGALCVLGMRKDCELLIHVDIEKALAGEY